jgi:hypothetical protein
MSCNLVEIYRKFGQTVCSLAITIATRDKRGDFGHLLPAMSFLWQRIFQWAVQIQRNVQLSHIAISGPEILLLWLRGQQEENVAVSGLRN